MDILKRFSYVQKVKKEIKNQAESGAYLYS